MNKLIVLIIFTILSANIFLGIEWLDMEQRYENTEKKLYEVEKALYECQQETETFADIVINKRWE